MSTQTVDAMRAALKPQPAIDPHDLHCAELMAVQARNLLAEAYKLVRPHRGMADMAERAGLAAKGLAARVSDARRGLTT